MQVVLAEPAERDLARIIDYIAQDNPTEMTPGVFSVPMDHEEHSDQHWRAS